MCEYLQKQDFCSIETVSGTKKYTDRKVGGIISVLQCNDTLFVTEISRFGRSLMEIMEIFNKLMNKKVRVIITKGGYDFKDDILHKYNFASFHLLYINTYHIILQELGKSVFVWIFVKTSFLQYIQSQVLAFAFGLSAQIERELISARTKEALAKVKSTGKKLGRPRGSKGKSKLTGKEELIEYYLRKKISVLSICKLLEVAPSTFYGFCKVRGIDLGKHKKSHTKI